MVSAQAAARRCAPGGWRSARGDLPMGCAGDGGRGPTVGGSARAGSFRVDAVAPALCVAHMSHSWNGRAAAGNEASGRVYRVMAVTRNIVANRPKTIAVIRR